MQTCRNTFIRSEPMNRMKRHCTSRKFMYKCRGSFNCIMAPAAYGVLQAKKHQQQPDLDNRAGAVKVRDLSCAESSKSSCASRESPYPWFIWRRHRRLRENWNADPWEVSVCTLSDYMAKNITDCGSPCRDVMDVTSLPGLPHFHFDMATWSS